MPRASNGTYTQPANTAAVSATTIGSAAYNSLITDIGSEITNSIDRGGRSSATANIPMGSFKLTGVGDPSSAQDAATKNYVDSNTALLFSTGDVKLTLKTAADSGWIMANDGTIGNVSSGATYANALALNLYSLLWANISNTFAPVTGGRGASAAADWAGLKPIALTTMLGRALAVAGAGSGLTARGNGQFLGEENHLLSIGEMPSHNHGGTSSGQSADHTHTVGGAGTTTPQSGTTGPASWWLNSSSATSGTSNDHTHTIPSQGSGSTHNNMQPSAFLNVMIKL